MFELTYWSFRMNAAGTASEVCGIVQVDDRTFEVIMTSDQVAALFARHPNIDGAVLIKAEILSRVELEDEDEITRLLATGRLIC